MEVTEAYSLKQLGEKIRAKAQEEGLTIAEEAVEKLAVAAYVGVKEWAKESAVLTPTPVDNFIAQFYDSLDPVVLPKIEEIDLDGDGQ